MKWLMTLILLLALHSQAAVWVHEEGREWDAQTQRDYAHWVATQVGPDFFKQLGSPYSALKLDCADAHYALLAYYSRMHRLPFIVNNGNTTNLTTQFDGYSNSDKRFTEFVKYLRQSFGTESLVHRDSFPPALSNLMPGDLFMYKVGSGGNYTRHTYIIKNINPDGTFDVLYSTQANAAAGGALKRKTSFMFQKAPVNSGQDKNRWGFRRLKPFQYAGYDHADIPGADFEQYRLAKSLSSLEFFRYVKKTNQTIEESPQMLLSRHFENMCTTLNERVEIVQKAITHQKKIGYACMNFQDYDTHSTPSRDSGIILDYNRYYADYGELAESNKLSQVKPLLAANTFTVFNSNRTEQERVQLENSCPVQFVSNRVMDMGSFQDALFKGDVSYHPNDNINWRWGIADGPRTRCEEYYGYPE